MRETKRTFAATQGMEEKAKIFSYAAKKAEAKGGRDCPRNDCMAKNGAKKDPPDASESFDENENKLSPIFGVRRKGGKSEAGKIVPRGELCSLISERTRGKPRAHSL